MMDRSRTFVPKLRAQVTPIIRYGTRSYLRFLPLFLFLCKFFFLIALVKGRQLKTILIFASTPGSVITAASAQFLMRCNLWSLSREHKGVAFMERCSSSSRGHDTFFVTFRVLFS